MDIKNWWEMKVNWAQIIGSMAVLATLAGVIVPEDVQSTVVALLVALQAAVTIIFRTYFTQSVSPAVAEKLKEEGKM